MGGGLNAGIAMVRFKDDPLHRVFIEKRFKPHDVGERTAHKEVSLLKQVGDHANITKMLDHFIDEEAHRACVYLEFCDKGSLLDMLRQGDGTQRINEHKVWEWLCQIMEALVYCHFGPNPENETESLNWATIYHRDVKPGNILLTRDKSKTRVIAKLADFGCAISDEWTYQTKDVSMASNASPQTPGFDPPEYPKFSSASDVWQLALAFVCVCNYEKEAPRSRLHRNGKQWDRARPAGPSHSWNLSQALRSCLVEDVAQRPGALHSLQIVRGAYDSTRQTLPADTQPLEILEKDVSVRSRPKDAMSISGFEQPAMYSASGQGYPLAPLRPGPEPQRPGLPVHILSDPGADQAGRLSYSHMGFLNGQRYMRSPIPEGRYAREVPYLYDILGEDGGGNEDDYMQDVDQSLHRAQYRYQVEHPPWDPRRPRYGRRH
ncbi:hypothetical protein NX059_001493 [Plenodomus lindquistii]|nr:hypothetical protein NX059_001493 [Plenodomus lindquistii]